MSRDRERIATLTCEEREAMLGRYDGWGVASSLTDMTGEFGEPRIETTWYPKETKGPLYVGVHDIRHPSAAAGDDVRPCEHYLVFIDERGDTE